MAVTPRIFISATSGDLKSHRTTVAAALKKLETYAEVQDDWPPDYATVSAMLRRRIKDCDAVIHLAGLRYGAEPRDFPPGVPRRSYTQMEYHLARELKKPVYTFILPDTFPYDDSAPVEDEEKRALQNAHRGRLAAASHLYYRPGDHTALEMEVLALHPLVEKLRSALRRQRLYVTGAIAALLCVSAGIAWAVLREKDINIRQDKAIAKLQLAEPIEVTFFKEIQARRSQSPIASIARSGGGAPDRISYADALDYVAKDHGLAPDALRGQLDAFSDKVLADSAYDDIVRGYAEFHRENYPAAVLLATSSAAKAEKEEARYAAEEAAATEGRKKARDTRIRSWTLAGDAEREQAHYKEALDAYQKALALAGKADDPKRWANVAMNVAEIHFLRADWKTAESILQEILSIRESAGGTENSEFSTVLNNLALLYHSTNRFEEAERLMRRSLAIDEAILGGGHPDVATHLHNLARLLRETNRPAEAEPLMRRVLAIDEATFGPGHPNVAAGLHNLGRLLSDTNRRTDAEPLLRRALAINEASLGPDHPKVVVSLNNLGTLLQATKRPVEAEQLIRRAITIDEAADRKDHPSLATSLNNLAVIFQSAKRFEEAEPLLRRALAIDEASFGPDHRSVASRLNNLGQLLQATKRLEEAEPVIRRALAIDEASYGKDHPNVARDLNNLALLLMATDRRELVEPLMRRAIEIYVASSVAAGHAHPRLKSAAENYCKLLIAMGDTDEQSREKTAKLMESPGRSLEALEKLREEILNP